MLLCRVTVCTVSLCAHPRPRTCHLTSSALSSALPPCLGHMFVRWLPAHVVCHVSGGARYMLLDHAQIQKRLEVVGRHISEDYAGKNPLVVGVLTGAIMVVADLVRHITIPCELDFLAASSCVFAILCGAACGCVAMMLCVCVCVCVCVCGV